MSLVLIDWQALQELIDAFGMPVPQAAESIYVLFCEEVGNQIVELELAMADADRVRLAKMAHRLRGGLSQLGACGIADMGAQIEQAAPTANLGALEAHVINLRARYDETIEQVRDRYRLFL